MKSLLTNLISAAAVGEHLGGKRLFSGEWETHCPAHDDRQPSLSLADGDDGQILVYCHAGCSQTEVITALKVRGLWPERSQQQSQTRRATAIYDYTDEHGGLLYHLREVIESPIVLVTEGEKDVETLRDHGFVATTNAGGANAFCSPRSFNWPRLSS